MMTTFIGSLSYNFLKRDRKLLRLLQQRMSYLLLHNRVFVLLLVGVNLFALPPPLLIFFCLISH